MTSVTRRLPGHAKRSDPTKRSTAVAVRTLEVLEAERRKKATKEERDREAPDAAEPAATPAQRAGGRRGR